MNRRMRRLAPATMLAALMLAGAQPASAANFPTSDPLPGCEDFDITVSGTNGNQTTKVIREKNGFIRTVTGGDGFVLTFTNVETGKSITVPTNGSVTHILAPKPPASGTTTFTLTGQNVFIFFPSDTGGARTILYTGRAVITNDSEGKSTFRSATGKQRNLCDALA